MVRFGELLDDYIKRGGLAVTTFAERARVTDGQVHNVIAGRRRPPVGQELEQYANALDLVGKERADFMYRADLERTPERIAEHLRKVEDELSRVVGELKDVRNRLGKQR